MASVPLGFWPDDLSSLGWLIVILSVFGSELIGHQLAIYGVMIGLVIFVLDVLVLGPLWVRMVGRKK